jgi:hypothetical protein
MLTAAQTQSLTSIAKRKFILDYCNETLELIFFGTNGLTELCALSLVRETIAAKVDSIVIKVDTSFNDNKDGKYVWPMTSSVRRTLKREPISLPTYS